LRHENSLKAIGTMFIYSLFILFTHTKIICYSIWIIVFRSLM